MMDRTDYQILNLLQDDSRCTLRRMGDLVGLTPPAVSERIRRRLCSQKTQNAAYFSGSSDTEWQQPCQEGHQAR
mgnify:CR=1 FL=1